MKHTFAALAFTVVAAGADAAEWVELGRTRSAVITVDANSVKRAGQRVQAWIRWTLLSPEQTPGLPDGKMFQSELNLDVYLCDARTSATLQIMRYSETAGGELVQTLRMEDRPSLYIAIAPDTIGETMLTYVCGR